MTIAAVLKSDIARTAQIFLLALVLCCAAALIPSQARASSLTPEQIDAVIQLLVAFEVDDAIVQNVETILNAPSAAASAPVAVSESEVAGVAIELQQEYIAAEVEESPAVVATQGSEEKALPVPEPIPSVLTLTDSFSVVAAATVAVTRTPLDILVDALSDVFLMLGLANPPANTAAAAMVGTDNPFVEVADAAIVVARTPFDLVVDGLSDVYVAVGDF